MKPANDQLKKNSHNTQNRNPPKWYESNFKIAEIAATSTRGEVVRRNEIRDTHT